MCSKTNPLKLSSALIKKISSSAVLDKQRVIIVDRIFPAENKDSSGLSAAVPTYSTVVWVVAGTGTGEGSAPK